ncbi:MAG TPA: hypothetical protein VLT16_00570 [Candidatus Limnocylindrales bacterium]|nr:hypothetical protein [Candidatus Limnocylindrales bacterium]
MNAADEQIEMFNRTSDWQFREVARLISMVPPSAKRERQIEELRKRNLHLLCECERFMERYG